MTSKLISLREDIYDRLQQIKNSDESFSELIERLLNERKKNVLLHFGNGRDLPEGCLDEFENAILEAKEDDIKLQAQKQDDLLVDQP
ncbi:MAG TPA: antitoxin VapB family protein [Candidatus Lokiarchaeia archaeon]|nr:antitoxin VapB family protein [Candidatus Lokiarchaeia archaeon]